MLLLYSQKTFNFNDEIEYTHTELLILFFKLIINFVTFLLFKPYLICFDYNSKFKYIISVP